MQQAPDHHALSALPGNLQELTTEQIAELTAYLERRLRTMGADGDCAYERALTTVYHQLLDTLHDKLHPT